MAKNAKRLKEYFSNRYYDNLEKERAVRRLWREKNKDYKRAKDKSTTTKMKRLDILMRPGSLKIFRNSLMTKEGITMKIEMQFLRVRPIERSRFSEENRSTD